MPEKQMRGMFPILVTPFDEDSRIDVDSLQSLVEFLIGAGAHGVGVALGSEVFKFTEDERRLVTRTVVGQARGRVPVVINSGGGGTEATLHYSTMAQEDGADALMIMPPSFMPAGGAQIRAFFKAVSDAVDLPIFIQDTDRAHVSAELALQIAQESEHVRYIKVESHPTTVMVAETARMVAETARMVAETARMVAETAGKAGDTLTVFGGAGGNYFIEEMRRGSVGTMPFCSHPEAFVEVWNHFQAGDEQGAREVFYRRILPINRISAQGWGAAFYVHKEILRQRGVIRTAVVRGPTAPVDDLTRRELQTVIDELYPSS